VVPAWRAGEDRRRRLVRKRRTWKARRNAARDHYHLPAKRHSAGNSERGIWRAEYREVPTSFSPTQERTRRWSAGPVLTLRTQAGPTKTSPISATSSRRAVKSAADLQTKFRGEETNRRRGLLRAFSKCGRGRSLQGQRLSDGHAVGSRKTISPCALTGSGVPQIRHYETGESVSRFTTVRRPMTASHWFSGLYARRRYAAIPDGTQRIRLNDSGYSEYKRFGAESEDRVWEVRKEGFRF